MQPQMPQMMPQQMYFVPTQQQMAQLDLTRLNENDFYSQSLMELDERLPTEIKTEELSAQPV
jgi:hypothetical protein